MNIMFISAITNRHMLLVAALINQLGVSSGKAPDGVRALGYCCVRGGKGWDVRTQAQLPG